MFELKICCCYECNDGCGHNSIVNRNAKTVCPKCGNENVSFIVKKGNLDSLNNLKNYMDTPVEAPSLLNKAKIKRMKKKIIKYFKDNNINIPTIISISVEKDVIGNGMSFRFLKDVKFDECNINNTISENVLKIIDNELSIDDICILKEIRLK